MRGGAGKIMVGRQQRQFVTDAQLREQSVDRADLHAGATTAIAQFCGVNVIPSIGSKERQGGRPFNDVVTRARTSESLEQFLEDQPRGHDDLALLEGMTQGLHLRGTGVSVATQGEGPNAGVDEQRHRRERSAL